MIVNQNASKIANMVVDRNWLDRGQNSVCITYGKCSNVTLTLQNNHYGRNQWEYGNDSKHPFGFARSLSPPFTVCGPTGGRTTTC